MDKLLPRVRLISDFNASNLAGYLRNEMIGTSVEVAPLGQVLPELLRAESAPWQGTSDCAVVWTRPESVLPSFQKAVFHKPIQTQEIQDEVDSFAASILHFSRRVKLVCVPTWVLSSGYRGLGMLDLKHPHGLSRLLLQANLRLAQQLEQASNVFVLDAQRWISNAGCTAFNPKLWYMAKIPFSNEVQKGAALDITSCIQGFIGKTRKLIVVDLDDTLWGGVVGDLGWENLRLGGHDYMGEAYVDFQRSLLALAQRGVLLGIVSKNNEDIALSALRNHPDMVLRPEHFAGWKINWNDKAQNIVDLAAELNLGLQSIVFIDDNPVERARVREALPDIHVPEWPGDCLLYTNALHSLRCFDAPALSAEDSLRTSMYTLERHRTELRKCVGNLDDWLKTLELVITVEKLNDANLKRAAQLLNKTNQMNLATRRLSEIELENWVVQSPERELLTFRVEDKFGDSGLTGIASFEMDGKVAHIVDFLLSCRVMGRRIEEAMLHILIQHALAAGASTVQADYLPTQKNQPCLEFLERSGLQRTGSTFVWQSRMPYPAPDCVQIQHRELAHA